MFMRCDDTGDKVYKMFLLLGNLNFTAFYCAIMVYGIKMREILSAFTWGSLTLLITLVNNYLIGFLIVKMTKYGMMYNENSLTTLVQTPIKIILVSIYLIMVMLLSLIIYQIDHKME